MTKETYLQIACDTRYYLTIETNVLRTVWAHSGATYLRKIYVSSTYTYRRVR